jgi:hypothetical protein
MHLKVRLALTYIIMLGLLFYSGGVDFVLAAPANAISNELRATIQVQQGQATLTFDAAHMTLEPGYQQAAGYMYRSTINDWLTAHLTSASVQGAVVSTDQIKFITYTNGPGSAVQWQGYTISDISGAVITPQGQIGENLNITRTASAQVTLNAINYQNQVYELNALVIFTVEINPYFTGDVQELNASQATIDVTDTALTVSGLKNGNNVFTLPAGAQVYRFFQPQEGLTPAEPALSTSMHLTAMNDIIEQQSCKVHQRWPSGRHDIYIADGASLYRLTLVVDHMGHDAAKAISYLKAGNDVLVSNAVRLSWAEGENEVPVHTVTCGQPIELPVQAWATDPLAVRLVAAWNGGTAAHEVDLVQGSNAGVVFTITFPQPGNFDISIYAELR